MSQRTLQQGIWLVVATFWMVAPLYAQPVTEPDSLRLLPFRDAEPFLTATDTIPALTSAQNITDILSGEALSFHHDFGIFGWPGGWSPYGLHPQRVTLQLSGIPFDDLITGRPRYDLLPMALLQPLGLHPARQGATMGVSAEIRPFAVQQPLTELHYQSGDNKLQRVTALHQQQRQLRLLGHPGHMSVLFAYAGGAVTGEYPGSRLRRMRQIFLRVRYQQAAWSVETTVLHNQRRLGAHSGVTPGTAYSSIYNRLIASVQNSEASRQTIRSDVSIALRGRVLSHPAEPLTIQLFRTTHTLRYRNPGIDTLSATAARIGGRVEQRYQIGRHTLRLLLEGWTDHLQQGNALPDGLTRTGLHVTMRDSLSTGNFAAIIEAGLHNRLVGGLLHLSQRLGSVRIFVDATRAGQPLSWVEKHGWGSYTTPSVDLPEGRVWQNRVGITVSWGMMDATVYGFMRRESHLVDSYATMTDHVRIRIAATHVRSIGAGGTLGFRRHASRGIYLQAQPATITFLGSYLANEKPLPSFFVRGRLGVRGTLFQEDLRLDISVRGRYWTAMRGRTLHAPTGTFALPGETENLFPDGQRLPASSILDLVVQVDIRTARLFFAYENILSGTQLLVGNQIVPLYPLPARQIRFGVFWPIVN